MRTGRLRDFRLADQPHVYFAAVIDGASDELDADLFAGDLLFSTDSSSSADGGGETLPWSTMAFASIDFP
jgi:hypothetical protein